MMRFVLGCALFLAGCDQLFGLQKVTSSDGGRGSDVPDANVYICGSLAPSCGPAGNASCCDSLLVPAGMFLRKYDVSTDGMYTDMSYPATVSAFRLDKYEVTVGRFRQFVEAGMGTQASPPGPGAAAHAAIAN